MEPGEISTLVVGLGGVFVTLLTLYFNRKGQIETRRDTEAARTFERMERELERSREDLEDMRQTLRENDALREFLKSINNKE